MSKIIYIYNTYLVTTFFLHFLFCLYFKGNNQIKRKLKNNIKLIQDNIHSLEI